MKNPFSSDDRGKDVVTHNGNRIGTIDSVNDDRATVDRDDDSDGLTGKVKDMLGWDDDDNDSNEIRSEHVDERNDDRVRLRQH